MHVLQCLPCSRAILALPAPIYTYTGALTVVLGAPLSLASIPTFSTYVSVLLLALSTLTSSAPHTISSVPDMEPLPDKLFEKIISWQYFDLTDLLPDQLQTSLSPATPDTQESIPLILINGG